MDERAEGGETREVAAVLRRDAAEQPTTGYEPRGPALAVADAIARDALKAMLFGAPRQVERIGRYRILGILGEGGMGVVFRAHDDELARPVALKVLRSQGRSAHQRARMLREAQAMAQLSHPNVAQVYDVGEHAGQVFIAMELVRGQTLSQWLTAFGEPAVRAARHAEVVACFVQAGRGLAAAHAVGLVHRDFKPANVLVADDGGVRVVDFGLARGVADEPTRAAEGLAAEEVPVLHRSLTVTGTVLGTPAYISPEQLRAEESGPASDQFSFCVALHEALLGVHPFEFHSLATLEAALDAGARSPRPRGVAAPAWLLAVIERGLAIDPRARWPTMDALLAALLDDPLHRRRRRIALAGVGLLAVGVVVGAHQVEARAVARCEAAGAVVEEGWSPAARAGLADAFARTGAPNAAETWDRFAAQVDGWTAGWRAARVDACLAARDEPGQGRLRERCLDRQRWQLDALLAVFSAVDAAMVQRAVNAAAALPPVVRCGEPGWLAAERGLAEEGAAEDTLRQQLVRVFVLEGAGRQGEALAVAEASVDAAVKLGDVALAAEARRNLGGMRWRGGDLVGAEADLRAAYFLAGGSGHDRVALEAAEELMLAVGVGLARYREGHEWGEHARMVLRRMGLDPERDDPPLHQALGQLHAEEGAHAAALAEHRRALELLRERLEPGHPDIAIALTRVGQVQRALGDYAEALAAQRQALDIAERALGPRHPYTLTIRETVAVTLADLTRHDEAIAEHRQTLALQEAVLGPDHPEVASTLNNLAAALRHQGAYVEAGELLARSLPIHERIHGAAHPAVAAVLGNLAATRARLGDPRGAIELLERALAIKEAAHGPSHPAVAVTLVNLGMRQQEIGELDAALVSFRRALAIDEATIGRDHPDYAGDLDSVGTVLQALGDRDGAREHYQRALALRERILGVDHPDRAASHDLLGVLARERGELAAALAHHRRALALREGAHGRDHPGNATSLIDLGDALAADGAATEARAAFERALAILEAAEGGAPVTAAAAHEGLARLDAADGARGPAIERLTRAVALRERSPGDPALLADARFALARLLGPAGRPQARLARDAYAALGPRRADALRRVDSWLD